MCVGLLRGYTGTEFRNVAAQKDISMTNKPRLLNTAVSIHVVDIAKNNLCRKPSGREVQGMDTE